MLEFDFWKSLLRISITLPLILILAYLFIKIILGRKHISFQKGFLHVVEQIGVGNKASLVVVRIGEEYFLFGVTEHKVELIFKLKDYVPGESLNLESEKFTRILAKLTGRRGLKDYEK